MHHAVLQTAIKVMPIDQTVAHRSRSRVSSTYCVCHDDSIGTCHSSIFHNSLDQLWFRRFKEQAGNCQMYCDVSGLRQW